MRTIILAWQEAISININGRTFFNLMLCSVIKAKLQMDVIKVKAGAYGGGFITHFCFIMLSACVYGSECHGVVLLEQ